MWYYFCFECKQWLVYQRIRPRRSSMVRCICYSGQCQSFVVERKKVNILIMQEMVAVL